MKIIGIYKITNTINGHFYIGSSINIKKRWNKHLEGLKRGVHANHHLLVAGSPIGYKHSKEARQKIGMSHMGKPSGMKGKSPSKEHRQKIR